MQSLKLVQIGNSVGVVLPKEVLVRLRVEIGDSIFVTESPHKASRLRRLILRLKKN
jgi:putative addiction module antidote